jgi:DNA-binding winged helix-turn-helix (wHTH) protein
MHEQEVYEFDRFRLEPSEGVLRHDGCEPVSLPPKAFDLLTVLVRRAGRLVTKEELLKEVWPDTFVEEANLSYNVSIIRKALGADESGEQYVETVPRRGYRFVARVKIAGRREEGSTTGAVDVPVSAVSSLQHPTVVDRHWRAVAVALAAFIIVSSAIGWLFRSPQTSHPRSLPRSLDRLTFDSGLQTNPPGRPTDA